MASPGRPPQRGDTFRRQGDPPRTHGRRSATLQASLLAPLTNRRNMYVQQCGRFLYRVPSVATLATRARLRPFWTPRCDAIGPPDPADFAWRKQPSEASMQSFCIEAHGDLLVGMCRRQRTDTRHGLRIRLPDFPRLPQAGDVERRQRSGCQRMAIVMVFSCRVKVTSLTKKRSRCFRSVWVVVEACQSAGTS